MSVVVDQPGRTDSAPAHWDRLPEVDAGCCVDGPSQFSVGFPFQAGPATVVNGVVHEHSRAKALSLISRAQNRVVLESLKEVQ